MSCGPEPEQNLEKALSRVADAAGRGAQVVCLPELFQTQYFCQREDHSLFDLAESIPGPASEKLAAAARQHNVVLIASLFEKRAPGIYHNTAAIFDSDGTLRGLYRKMHIRDRPGTGILGRIVLLRPLWPRHRRSLARPRRNPVRRRRPEGPGGHPSQLALPSRPKNRCLRPNQQPSTRWTIKSFNQCYRR